MRKQGILLITISVISIIAMIIFGVLGNYEYERDYLSYWNLAEKSSTIQQKSMYMDKFVESFKGKGFESSYNALVLKTPDNSFDKNFEALQSLKSRLDEIQKMNVTSFEYQTAIQQITAQEQGEAQAMLNVFSGIWWQKKCILLWDWVAAVCVFSALFVLLAGIIKLGGGLKKVREAMKESARQNDMRRMRGV